MNSRWSVAMLVPLLASSIWAMPANPKLLSITQPDGVQIQVRLKGDAFRNWLETSDGYTIVKNTKTNYFEFAAQDASGALYPSGLVVPPDATARQVAPSKLPPKGLRPNGTTH